MAKSFAELWKKVDKNISAFKANTPKEVGKVAQRNFTASFTNQGFDSKAWREVQRRIPGTDAYKYPKSKGLGRRKKAILIGSTGDLRRSVSQSLRSATWEKIKFQVSTPYAVYHNEGEGKIPKRQFIGSSRELSNSILQILNKNLAKCFK